MKSAKVLQEKPRAYIFTRTWLKSEDSVNEWNSTAYYFEMLIGTPCLPEQGTFATDFHTASLVSGQHIPFSFAFKILI